MGQVLSEPIRNKTTENGSSDRLFYGYSAMQGWRLSMLWLNILVQYECLNEKQAMEDAHTCVLNLGGHKEMSFFGVFDGHGGAFTI